MKPLTNQTSGFLEYSNVPLKVPASSDLNFFGISSPLTASVDSCDLCMDFPKGSITLPQLPSKSSHACWKHATKVDLQAIPRKVYILPFILVRYCHAPHNYLVMLFPTWKVPPFISFITFLPVGSPSLKTAPSDGKIHRCQGGRFQQQCGHGLSSSSENKKCT